MRVDDAVRLRHMLDAAKHAVSFSRRKTRQDIGNDRILALGLLKLIEIIGEAAANVSQGTRDQYPHVPWTDIVGMRNRLVHVYFDIDLDRVWDTVTQDLPPLIADLEKAIPPD